MKEEFASKENKSELLDIKGTFKSSTSDVFQDNFH